MTTEAETGMVQLAVSQGTPRTDSLHQELGTGKEGASARAFRGNKEKQHSFLAQSPTVSEGQSQDSNPGRLAPSILTSTTGSTGQIRPTACFCK